MELCSALLKLDGFGKSDAIGIHMPMMIETIVRSPFNRGIGAIAVPVFSGYGVDAIASRLNAWRQRPFSLAIATNDAERALMRMNSGSGGPKESLTSKNLPYEILAKRTEERHGCGRVLLDTDVSVLHEQLFYLTETYDDHDMHGRLTSSNRRLRKIRSLSSTLPARRASRRDRAYACEFSDQAGAGYGVWDGCGPWDADILVYGHRMDDGTMVDLRGTH